MGKSKSSKKQTPIKTIIWISAIVVFSLWALNFFLLNLGNDERGVFGDMFGAVNSLFSGLAFAGIIITIFLQSKELRLQRKELKKTKKEFKIQNSTLRLQRFENTFFSMLSLHHEIVKGIDWVAEEFDQPRSVRDLLPENHRIRRVNYIGRDVFELHYSELKRQLSGYTTQSDINDNYKLEYKKYQNDFDHYFRNLYRIIKLVNETQFTDSPESAEEFKEKYKYTSMVRAQLSTYELLWLFYNCLSENGFENFKPLLEKFTMLKNLRTEELAERTHKDLYLECAFRKDKNENFE